MTVDPDRAAAALALGATPVLGRPEAQPVTEYFEQRRAVVRDLDVSPVDPKSNQRLS
jgi:hypothetical protein